eukprot:gene9008-12150_t
MQYSYLFIIISALIGSTFVLCKVACFIPSDTLAIVFTAFFKLIFSRTVKSLKIGRITLYPFNISQFEVVLNPTRSKPEVLISFTLFKLCWNFSRILKSFACKLFPKLELDERFLTIVIDGMFIQSPNLKFQDVLNPSDSLDPTKKSNIFFDKDGLEILPRTTAYFYHSIIAAIIQFLLSFIEIKFNYIQFDFIMPNHNCNIEGTADIMVISFPLNVPGLREGISLRNSIKGGHIEIFYGGEYAVNYCGQSVMISCEVHLPTGAMDVKMKLEGNDDDVAVSIEPLLAFYSTYQFAEDNSIELKMARGIPTAGKMSIRVEFDFMKITVRDQRIVNNHVNLVTKNGASPLLIISMHHTIVEMRTHKLTLTGELVHKGRLYAETVNNSNDSGISIPHISFNRAAMRMSNNLHKIMMINVSKVEWKAFDGKNNKCFTANSISFKNNKRVINEKSFIDEDNMEIKIKSVIFSGVNQLFLDWLFIMQETADKLPSSRFSHSKNSKMNVSLDCFQFSTNPRHFSKKLSSNNKSYDFVAMSRLIASEDPIDENRSVGFSLESMVVSKKASFNYPNSCFEMTASTFTIQTFTPEEELENQYNILIESDMEKPTGNNNNHTESSYKRKKKKKKGNYKHSIPVLSTKDALDESSSSSSDEEIRDTRHHDDFHSKSKNKHSQNRIFDFDIDHNSHTHNYHSKKHKLVCTEWKFRDFKVNFVLGAKLLIKSLYASKFTIDFINSVNGSSSHNFEFNYFYSSSNNDSNDSSASSSAWQSFDSTNDNYNSSNDKNQYYDSFSSLPTPINSTPLGFLTSPFMSCSIDGRWNLGTKNLQSKSIDERVEVDLSDVDVVISMTGMIKFNCALDMIRITIDRITSRMEYIKSQSTPFNTKYINPNVNNHINQPHVRHRKTKSQNFKLRSRVDLPINDLLVNNGLLSEADIDASFIVDLSSGNYSLNQIMSVNISALQMELLFEIPIVTKLPVSGAHYNTSSLFDHNIQESHFDFTLINNYQKLFVSCLNFYYLTSTSENIIKFDKCTQFLNSYSRDPIVAIDVFKYHKIISNIDGNPDNLNVEISSFVANFAPDMNTRSAIEIGLAQMAAYKVASIIRVDDDEQIFTSSSTATEESKPIITNINISSFELSYDAELNGVKYPHFMTIEMPMLSITVNSTKSYLDVQDQLAELDAGPEHIEELGLNISHGKNRQNINSSPTFAEDEVISYKSIQGGDLLMTMVTFVVKFNLNENNYQNYITMEQVQFVGPFYSACASHANISREESLVALSDSIPQLHDDRNVSLFDIFPNNNQNLNSNGCFGGICYAIVTKDNAPSKIYLDLRVTMKSFDLTLLPETDSYVSVVLEAIDSYLPANIDPSPQLPLWDNLRYWFHGSYFLNIERFNIIQSKRGALSKIIKVTTSMENSKLHIDTKTFEYCCNYLKMEVEISSSAMLSTRRFFGNPLKVVRHQMLQLPGFILSLKHELSLNHVRTFYQEIKENGVYNHHDVYIRPAYAKNDRKEHNLYFGDDLPVYINNDKYYYFRTRPDTVDWNIEMRWADGVMHTDLIFVNLRLDVLLRLMSAFSNDNSNSSEPLTVAVTTPASNSKYNQGTPQSAQNQLFNASNPVTPMKPLNTPKLKSILVDKDEDNNNTQKLNSAIPNKRKSVNIQSISPTNYIVGKMIQPKTTSASLSYAMRFYAISNDPVTIADELFKSSEYEEKYVFLRTSAHAKTTSYISVIKPPHNTEIGSLMNRLDLQFIVDSITISSWISDTNFQGFIASSELIDIQLRMIREEKFQGLNNNSTISADENNIEISSLQIDHLFVEMNGVELYIRDWVNNDTGSNNQSNTYNYNINNDFYGKENDSFIELMEIVSSAKAINRIFSTTKMVVSLTEDGEVSSRSTAFVSTGILNQRNNNDQVKSSEFILSKSLTLSGKSLIAEKWGIESKFFDLNTNTPTAKDDMNLVTPLVYDIGKEWRKKVFGDGKSGCSMKKFLTVDFSQSSGDQDRYNTDTFSPKRIITSFAEVSPKLHERLSLQSSINVFRQGKKIGMTSSSSPINTKAKMLQSIRTNVWNPHRDGYRASLISFSNNHTAFTPPQTCLPTSFQKRKLNNHNNSNGKVSLHSIAVRSLHLKNETQNRNNFTNHNNRIQLENPDHNSSVKVSNKIWGLRVVEARVLMTIQIRDVLFAYALRLVELGSNEMSNNTNEKKANSPNKVQANNSINTNTENVTSKVSNSSRGSDQSIVNNPLHQTMKNNHNNSIKPSPKSEVDIAKTAATLHDFIKADMNNFEDSPSNSKHRKKYGNILPNSPNIDSGNKNNQETKSISDFLLNATIIPMKDQNVIISNSIDINDHPSTFISATSVKATKRRGAVATKNEKLSPLKSSSDINIGAVNSTDDVKSLPSKPKMRRNSLINKSIVFRDNKSDPVEEIPFVEATNSNNTNSSTSNKTTKLESNNKIRVVSQNQYYFMIELLDPQVNFLDVKTHSSLVIVAGTSALEGKRMSTASLPPDRANNLYDTDEGNYGNINNENNSDDENDDKNPKRKHEIRLRMDGVSAFTVPTVSSYGAIIDNEGDGEEDIVHWKSSNNNVAWTRSDTSFRRKPSKYHIDPTYFKMAIKDFKIRALYTFWTSISVKEAKNMYVRQSNEDLVGTFRLELPEICLDILSWQFNIITNVVKNVLLAPPPTAATTTRNGKDKDVAVSKMVELHRDPKLMERYGMRNLSQTLDINNTKNQEELRLLIDEDFNKRKRKKNNSTARFVEVFIGRGSWILRNESVLSTEKNSFIDSRYDGSELMEMGFCGISAEFDYNNNGCYTAHFDVQRVWARNLYPRKDTESFQDRSCILIPRLSEDEICTRCEVVFDPEKNSADSCVFHADADGEPGYYKVTTVLDELTGQPTPVHAWTCCGRQHYDVMKCSSRPHQCKESMIMMRLDGNPTMRIENIEMSVINSLEISIFPGVIHALQVQITKSLADVLHDYFNMKSFDHYEALVSKKALDSSVRMSDGRDMLTSNHGIDTSENAGVEGSGSHIGKGPKRWKNIFKKNNHKKSISSPSSPSTIDNNNGYNFSKTNAAENYKVNNNYYDDNNHNNKLDNKNSNSNSNNNMDQASMELQTSESVAISEFKKERDGHGIHHQTSSQAIKPQLSSCRQSWQGTSYRRIGPRTGSLKMKKDVSSNSNTVTIANTNKRSRKEGLYIKHLKIMQINLVVSTAGFTPIMNFSKFKADIQPFTCDKK